MKNITRGKKLYNNTITSLIYQITTIACGFILPRFFLSSYGSNVNGLISSIMQFLGIISFLDLGVGAVVRSSLYKPLAENDSIQVSKIIVSANRFYKKIAYILLGYIGILIVTFPMITSNSFEWFYTTTLILSISISSFAQYYFGIVDRLLLVADQKSSVQNNAMTITLVLNTIACIILMYNGASIQIVKLTTSLIFLLRPLYLRYYVNKHYEINRHITYDNEPIKQKWYGMAQHFAAVVLDGTDNIVLTFLSTLENVSIYSVYTIVIIGVKNLLLSATTGINALLGELWAKKEIETLKNTFGWFEWVLHTGTVYIFGCTLLLILPFVQVYTLGINDANYHQPLFAILIVFANSLHCLRLPYNVMILVCGHYKETQRCYIFAALINIIVSVFAVKKFGLIGVSIGTLIAMAYQTIWMAVYNSKEFIKWPLKNFIKQLVVDFLIIFINIGINIFKISELTYVAWFILAIKVAIVFAIISFIVNYIFYKDKILELIDMIKKRIFKKKIVKKENL